MIDSKQKLISTKDGSLTLFDEGTHQHYHNRAGAYTEALENYTEPSGILSLAKQQEEVTILDACYGLGYNTWVTVQQLSQAEADTKLRHLHVHAVEFNPALFALSLELLQQPCFKALINSLGSESTQLEAFFSHLASTTEKPSQASTTINLSNKIRLQLTVYIDDLRQCVQQFSSQEVDCVFHDPFSPQKMPELWTVDLFKQYQRILKEGGRLLTYSLASAVRSGLLEAGFTLYKSKAVGDKPGGTVAINTTDFTPHPNPPPQGERGFEEIKYKFESILLPAFTTEEWEALQTRSGIPFRDAGLNSSRENVLQKREEEQNSSGKLSSSQFKKQLTK